MALRLLLFDLEGTLMLGDDQLARYVMSEALERLTGSSVSRQAFAQFQGERRTARGIADEVTRRCSLGELDLERWVDLVEQLYLDHLPRHASWEAPARARATLTQLRRDGFRLALLTRLPKRIARVRLERLDLDDVFPERNGAYGSEAEDRQDLVRLALRRADVPPHEAVEIGGTGRNLRRGDDLGLYTIATGFAAGTADSAVPTMAALHGAIHALAAVIAASRLRSAAA